jgi:signal transduction histidine kinase
LKEEHAAELSEEAQRYLDRVLHGANHMGHLVDDLLNLAKIGRRELTRQKAKLDLLVRVALNGESSLYRRLIATPDCSSWSSIICLAMP